MSLTPGVESIGHIVLVTAWVCPGIVLPVFALRLHAALHVLKRWHNDDTLMALAVIFALANSTVASVQTQHGLGMHIADLSLEMLSSYLWLNITGAMTTYNLATMCTKSSILLYYLRFPSSRAFRIATYTVLIVSVGYTTSGLFSWAYNCSPMEKSWDTALDGTCIDTSAGLLARSVLNVVTDLSILLLPIWLLWPLRLWSIWHKLAVLMVLMAGGFVCVASILRLAAFWTDSGETKEDQTWHYVRNSIWCLLEVWVGVFCACLPSLKCLCVHYFPTVFSNRRNFGNRRSLLSMIQIPVTDQGARDERSEGVAHPWQVVSRIGKKPSCGSSEPDLEAQGYEKHAGEDASSNSGYGRGLGEREGERQPHEADPASYNV